jgi:hypothetical protein
MIEELKEFSDANRWVQMQTEGDGWGADIMYPFESAIISLNQYLLKQVGVRKIGNF